MSVMADFILHLVDRSVAGKMLGMSVGEIASGMEAQSMRDLRPEPDSRFHRDFEVDLEGDILELIDNSTGFDMGTALSHHKSEPAFRLAVLLARWSSIAQWSCWDARLYLYVEPILGRQISSTAEFVMPSLWEEFSTTISNSDRLGFSESVILDWMRRRESLGETMEPSEDSRILPTMKSHKSLSESLFSMMELSRKNGHDLLVGRDYLEAGEWNLGGLAIPDALGAFS